MKMNLKGKQILRFNLTFFLTKSILPIVGVLAQRHQQLLTINDLLSVDLYFPF
jgi:hypothetical protein